MQYCTNCILTLIPVSGSFQLFFFYPEVHSWCNKDHGLYYPIHEIVHLKDPIKFMKWWKIFVFVFFVCVVLHISNASLNLLLNKHDLFFPFLSAAWQSGLFTQHIELMIVFGTVAVSVML